MAQQYDNTNQGAGWGAAHMAPIKRGQYDDSIVFRQGKLDVEKTEVDVVITKATSRDNKTYYEVYEEVDDRVLVVQCTSQSNEIYYKFYNKIGYINPNNKRTPKDPDMSGVIRPSGGGGQEYMIWGRNKQTKAGADFLALSISVKTNQGQRQGNQQGQTPQQGHQPPVQGQMPMQGQHPPTQHPPTQHQPNQPMQNHPGTVPPGNMDDDIPF